MTLPEASASLSQGFEAVDSPRTRAASFRGGPQGPPQRLLPQSEGPGGGNVWQRAHCNTDEEVEMETLFSWVTLICTVFNKFLYLFRQNIHLLFL